MFTPMPWFAVNDGTFTLIDTAVHSASAVNTTISFSDGIFGTSSNSLTVCLFTFANINASEGTDNSEVTSVFFSGAGNSFTKAGEITNAGVTASMWYLHGEAGGVGGNIKAVLSASTSGFACIALSFRVNGGTGQATFVAVDTLATDIANDWGGNLALSGLTPKHYLFLTGYGTTGAATSLSTATAGFAVPVGNNVCSSGTGTVPMASVEYQINNGTNATGATAAPVHNGNPEPAAGIMAAFRVNFA